MEYGLFVAFTIVLTDGSRSCAERGRTIQGERVECRGDVVVEYRCGHLRYLSEQTDDSLH